MHFSELEKTQEKCPEASRPTEQPKTSELSPLLPSWSLPLATQSLSQEVGARRLMTIILLP